MAVRCGAVSALPADRTSRGAALRRSGRLAVLYAAKCARPSQPSAQPPAQPRRLGASSDEYELCGVGAKIHLNPAAPFCTLRHPLTPHTAPTAQPCRTIHRLHHNHRRRDRIRCRPTTAALPAAQLRCRAPSASVARTPGRDATAADAPLHSERREGRRGGARGAGGTRWSGGVPHSGRAALRTRALPPPPPLPTTMALKAGKRRRRRRGLATAMRRSTSATRRPAPMRTHALPRSLRAPCSTRTGAPRRRRIGRDRGFFFHGACWLAS